MQIIYLSVKSIAGSRHHVFLSLSLPIWHDLHHVIGHVMFTLD